MDKAEHLDSGRARCFWSLPFPGSLSWLHMVSIREEFPCVSSTGDRADFFFILL